MPKNRNRTVTNNFEFPPDFLKTLPYPEKLNASGQKASIKKGNSSNLCFGEPVPAQHDKSYKDYSTFRRTRNSSSSSDYDNATSGVSDFDIVSFGKSSSSSVSWSDDFDVESTQRVQNEFERMERVLQGKETIPSHYNRDEYEQWINTFPQLSITGNKLKCPAQHNQSNKSSNDNYEEIIAFDSDVNYFTGNCDRVPTSPEMKKINNIKNAVIEQVFQNVSSKLLNKKTISKTNNVKPIIKNQKRTEPKLDHLNQNNNPNLAQQFDSFLRISPALLQESTKKSTNYLDTRHQSSNSVSRSDRLASKWMREEAVEYSSLPYLSTASAKHKTRKPIRRKNSTSSKSRYSSKLSPNRNNYVSLPPIKTLSLPSANQYRSISATPRQPSKGSSAMSVQVDSQLGKKKSRFEVAGYLVQNDLEPRRNLLKQPKQM